METKKRRKKAVKRTPESYRKEVSEATNGEYSVLGDFKNTRTKILHGHNECGYEWEVVPNSFINKGSRCPNCAGKIPVKRTPESYRKEVSEITDGEYSVLGAFKSTKSKILHVHNECGYEWGIIPGHFLYLGARCPKCAGLKRRRTPEEYREELSELTNGEYSVLGDFVDMTTKVLHVHTVCGHEWEVRPHGIIHSGSGCPKCSGAIRLSDEDFKNRVYDLVGGEYIFLESYVSSRSPLEVIHVVCGNSYEVLPQNFLAGSRCPKCSTNRKSIERFVSEVYDLVGEEYVFQEPYVDTRTPLEVKHVACGHSYKVRPSAFTNQGSRCPNCVYSRGEKAVADVLDSLSIEYSREHTFEYLGLKRYDFFIPSLNIAIEFDGEQHFEARDFFGGEEALKRTQESDALKNDFCDYMGIDLLRIPYWEFDNIDEIVTNFIDTVKLMRSISDRKEA